MTCGFCGAPIDESLARHACASCPLGKDGCRRLRCPRCGYENPETPAIFRRLTAWREAREQRKTEKRDANRKSA